MTALCHARRLDLRAHCHPALALHFVLSCLSSETKRVPLDTSEEYVAQAPPRFALLWGVSSRPYSVGATGPAYGSMHILLAYAGFSCIVVCSCIPITVVRRWRRGGGPALRHQPKKGSGDHVGGVLHPIWVHMGPWGTQHVGARRYTVPRAVCTPCCPDTCQGRPYIYHM